MVADGGDVGVADACFCHWVLLCSSGLVSAVPSFSTATSSASSASSTTSSSSSWFGSID